MENKDLSKPFFRWYEEGSKIIVESNMPNDQIGDFAFEWDLDGSLRKKWQDRIKQLEKEGTCGDLVYSKLEYTKHPALDIPSSFEKDYPLDSYTFLILDVNGE